MSDLLTTAEAAVLLRCHPETVLRAIRRGQIPAVRFGGRYLIEHDDLPRALAPQRQRGGRRRGPSHGPISAAVRQMESAS